ncbi:MAG: methyltransferase [Gammaproteobacteria bacterium]|nr:MAG: methyltransferase [Gammaproteobacteria bacterium]
MQLTRGLKATGLKGFAGAVLLVLMHGAHAKIPTYIAIAVADSNRPSSDTERDADRKPAAVIAFAGLKPGDKVADFMPGRGYFTKIFCNIVGDTGRVYAITLPRQTPKPAPDSAPTPDSPSTPDSEPRATSSSSSKPATAPLAPACNNVIDINLKGFNKPAPELHSSSDDPGWVYEYWSSRPAAESFAAPEPLDMIWTSENYHDLHNKSLNTPDMLEVNKALFAALKPGGILIIEDHAAAPRSGTRDTERLHRIDPKQVKKEALAAGFKFVGGNNLLRNSQDPHTTKAHEMHDKTDRFLLKFRKPK